MVQEPTGGAVINPSILEWCNVRDGGTWDLHVVNAANSRVLGRRLLPPIILPFTFFPSNCLNRSFSSQVHFVLSLSDPSFPCLSYHPGPLSRDSKCQQVFPQTSCCVRFGGRWKRTPVTPGWLTAESRGCIWRLATFGISGRLPEGNTFLFIPKDDQQPSLSSRQGTWGDGIRG